MRLVNVARASLDELLLDYEDFLRHRRLPQWDADGAEAMGVRDVPKIFRQNRTDRTDQSDRSDLTDLTDAQRWELYSRWLDHADPVIRANATICLIHQANYLLDRQIASLEEAFIEDGGYSEQLATERLRKRTQDRQDSTGQTDRTHHSPPNCPLCGALMALRTAKTGNKAGSQFWGCTSYPECKGTTPS